MRLTEPDPPYSFLPVLCGERKPTATVNIHEMGFYDFLQAAEQRHGAALHERLIPIEQELNHYDLSLVHLFPYLSMRWELHTLGEWKRLKIPRGRRPKRDLRRVINAITECVNSEHVDSKIKVMLTGELARLRNLLDRDDDAFKPFPAPLVDTQTMKLEDVSGLIKRANAWEEGKHGPLD